MLVTATNPAPDAGCYSLDGALGFTGRVLVGAAALSYDVVLLP